MSRARFQKTDPPGQDSFLDVVANLVGILIILVVVIGAHAGASWTAHRREGESAKRLQQLQVDAEQARLDATSRASHNRDVERQIQAADASTRLLDAQRNEMLIRIQLAQQELDRRVGEANATQQQSVERQRQIDEAHAMLISLQRELSSLDAIETGPSVIEHLPTPIAKTVFTNEVHFRLKNQRLAFVPLNELVEEMRNEWRVSADNLKFGNETVETVGPIEGFRMQYKLGLVETTIDTDFGPIVRQGPEFIGFVLLPLNDSLGTTIGDALQPNSWLDSKLRRLDPRDTTITVWVYPDSYAEFAMLKRWLFERSFLTAGWPLPDGYPIAGGPNGYRSTAQ